MIYSAGQALRDANAAGRLGLILYAVPGFPDPGTYQAVIDHLAARPSLSVLETTFPVTDRFSGYANTTIRAAHKVASANCDDISVIDHLRAFPKPVILVLYRATFDDYGFEPVLDRCNDTIDGLLFEWDIGPTELYVAPALRREMELIQCAGNWMSPEELDATLALTGDTPLIYLVSAAKTGANLHDVQDLAKVISAIREIKPDAQIAAGFGVATAEHIRELKTLSGLNGIIIGTAFLDVMREGFDATVAYLDGLEPALRIA